MGRGGGGGAEEGGVGGGVGALELGAGDGFVQGEGVLVELREGVAGFGGRGRVVCGAGCRYEGEVLRGREGG